MGFSADSTSGSHGTSAADLEKKDTSPISPIPPPVRTDAAASHTHSTTLDRDDNSNDNDTMDPRSKKPKKKGPKKRSPKPRITALGDQAQILRDQINSLKDQLQTITEVDQEYQKIQYAIEQLEQVYAKLSASTSPSVQPPSKRHGLTSDETMTMLHFFYMVRLIQQGFFSLMPDLFAGMEMEAVVYFCDRLVGSSLLLGPNNSPKRQVFDLLRKLHDGVDEPVGPSYTTTYSQILRAIQHAIKASLHPPPPPPEQQSINAFQPPVWVVVPFNSMIDFQQQQQQQQPSVPGLNAASITSNDKCLKSTDAAETSPGLRPPQSLTQSTNSNHSTPSLSVSTKEDHEHPCQNENVPDDHPRSDEIADGETHHPIEGAEGEYPNRTEIDDGEDHRHDGNGNDEQRQEEGEQPRHNENTDNYFEGGRGGRGGRGRGSRGRGYRRGRGRGRGLYPPRGGGGDRGFHRGDGAGKIWVPRESTG